MSMDIVKVVNEHPTKTHHIDYYATRYTLAPGDEALLPFEAIASVLGHPGIYNRADGKASARRDVFLQLERYWGFHQGFDTPEQHEEKQPRLAVYDQAGERIWMLFDDPEGIKGQTSAIFGEVKPAATTDRVSALEQQVAALLHANQKLLARLDGAEPTTVDRDLSDMGIEPAPAPAPDTTPTFPAESHGTAGSTLGVQEIPEPPAGTGAVVDTAKPAAPVRRR
jgi:hypothetical protein